MQFQKLGEYFKLENYVSNGKYSDSKEVYQGILSYLEDYLKSDSNFDKLLYKYLIKSGRYQWFTDLCHRV